MSSDGNDHAVGYKRPPTKSRFKAGKSGNPTGRPKRAPTFRAALVAELAKMISGGADGVLISKQEALAKNLVDLALAGSLRAASVLLPLLARGSETDETDDPEISPEDREILEAYVNRRQGALSPKKPSASGGE